MQYIACAKGKIHAALALDALYPTGEKVTVALRVADGADSTWVHYFEPIYDDSLVEQPNGQVGLYVSDFLGSAGLPMALCRPLAAERAAGIARYVFFFLLLSQDQANGNRDPQVWLSFERLRAIFLQAKSIHQGTYTRGHHREECLFSFVMDAKAARERAEAAEQRADAAEQRLAALEEQLRHASM